jgi:hypothetical protein
MTGSSFAQGFRDWHWSFYQIEYRVGSSDSVSLSATIYVLPESPGPLIGRATISFQGTLFGLYDSDCAFCRDDRLADANIPPGGSLHFMFATLTPKSPIAPGTYRNSPDEPLISFEELGTRHVADSPLLIQVIPEPAALALLAFGAALFLSHREACRPRWRKPTTTRSTKHES